MKDRIIIFVLLIFFSILIIYDGYVAVVTERFATRSGLITGQTATFEGSLQILFGILCIVILVIALVVKGLRKKSSVDDK